VKVLGYAYRKAKLNKGDPAVDGQTFEMIEEEGREAWLGELAMEPQEKTYVPGAVRRTYIMNPNGKT
jgi:RNA-directed DNA polymerase